MAVTIAPFMILIALLAPVPIIAQNKPVPRTPSEAYQRATEPLRQWGKSKNQTLETNIKAHQEQERRAKQYVGFFKIEDWKGKQLFDLGQLYFVALLPEGTERAFTAYLRNPAETEVAPARRNLLWAFTGQKKWDEAIPVAEQLLNDPKYDWDVNTYVQFLIEGLRAANVAKAIALSERRLPKLLQLAEAKGNNPLLSMTILDSALELGSMYRESGNIAQSEAFISSFLSRFRKSSLASNEKIKQSVDAAVRRISLLGMQAPPIEGTVYVDVPEVNVSELKGKVVLLDFLAHWCAPCIMSFPALDSLKEKYESKGLVIIGVTQYYGFFGEHEKKSEEEELLALKALKAERKAKLGFIVGPKSNFTAYGVIGLPAYAFIDRAGKVRVIKTGIGVGEEVEKIVQSLIAEPTPSNNLRSAAAMSNNGMHPTANQQASYR